MATEFVDDFGWSMENHKFDQTFIARYLSDLVRYELWVGSYELEKTLQVTSCISQVEN